MHRTRFIRLINYLGLAALLLAGLGGCRKDVDEFHPYPDSFADLEPLLTQVPKTTTKTVFSFSNALIPDTLLITPSGVRVEIKDTENLFADADGTVVPASSCQNLNVTVLEVLRKGDMIARHIPGLTTDGKMIESGGMINLEVTCDGERLQLLSNRNIKIQIPETNPRSDLLVFTGFLQQDSVAGWENTGEPVYQADWIDPGTGDPLTGYEIITSSLGWINAGVFLNGATSSFCIDLPDGFSGLNTQAFVVFKDQLIVARLIPDANGNYCVANAPNGYLVKIVTISKLGGQFWLGNKETEIGTNSTVDLAPQQMNEQQVLNFLKSL